MARIRLTLSFGTIGLRKSSPPSARRRAYPPVVPSMPRRSLLVGLSALVLGSAVHAQQHADASHLPMVVGHGTQGFVVYRGPAIPDFFWFCDFDGTDFSSVGEVAEEVHMVQSGLLSSITWAYHVQGNDEITNGLADAIINVYANDATDSGAPPSGLLASYTVTDLPWNTDTNHTATFDIPTPFNVSKDLWIGIEMVTPGGTAGSVMGAGMF